MAQGNIIKLAGEFTDDNLPRYYPNDAWIDKSTLILLDWGKVKSWPTLAAPTFSGQVVTNLVETQVNSLITVSAPSPGYRENGLDFTTGGNVNMGTALTDFDLNTLGSPDFLIILWVKRETGFSTANYQSFIGRGSSTAADACQLYMNTNAGGNGLTIGLSNGTVLRTINLTGSDLTAYQALLNTTMQLAMAYEGGTLKLFINGVLIKTDSTTNLKPYLARPAHKLSLSAGAGGTTLKGIFKRFGLCKLDAGKTAQERVTLDYNMNKVRLQTPA